MIPGGRLSLAIALRVKLLATSSLVSMVPTVMSLFGTITSTFSTWAGPAFIRAVRKAATRPHPTATTIRIRFFCFMVPPLGDKWFTRRRRKCAAAPTVSQGDETTQGPGTGGTSAADALPAAGRAAGSDQLTGDGGGECRSENPTLVCSLRSPVFRVVLSGRGLPGPPAAPNLPDQPVLRGVAVLLPRPKIRPGEWGFFSLSGRRKDTEFSQFARSVPAGTA